MMNEIARIRAFISDRDFGARDHFASEVTNAVDHVEIMLNVKKASEQLEYEEWKNEKTYLLTVELRYNDLTNKVAAAVREINDAINLLKARDTELTREQTLVLLNIIERRLSIGTEDIKAGHRS